MSLKLNSSGGGSVTLQEPTTASNLTLSLPAVSATVLTDSAGVLNIGSGQIYKDASGNVGFGTSSPGALVHASSATDNGYRVTKTGQSDWVMQTLDGGVLRLYSYTAGAERARIDSSGALLLGTTVLSPNTGVLKADHNGAGQNIATFRNTASSNPFGNAVTFSAAAPNNASNYFQIFIDSVAERCTIRSNGGIANYSANNVNLSDARLKTDVQQSGSYLAKICAIPVVTYLYKDQTDTERNLGVLAQDVEAVAPELVDNSGFGEAPEGEAPYKAVYQTDLQYALMKCIQELKAELDALRAQVEAK